VYTHTHTYKDTDFGDFEVSDQGWDHVDQLLSALLLPGKYIFAL